MIYFDNAATTVSKPEKVIKAVTEAMQNCGNAKRGAHRAASYSDELIYNCRKKVKNLYNCRRITDVAFTKNATEALNIIINSYMTQNAHVVTTPYEHNSVLRPIYNNALHGAEYSFLEMDSRGIIDFDSLEKVIRPETRALIMGQASNVTGNIYDIAKAGELCKKYGIDLVVDASQSAGYLTADMQEMNISALAFSGHKSLYGPQGIGVLCMNSPENPRPILYGGSGSDSFARDQGNVMPALLEAGTLNTHGIAGLGAAIDVINDIGFPAIEKKGNALAQRFIKGIKDNNKIKIYGDYENKKRVPVVSINIEEMYSGEVASILFEDYDIAVRSGIHCAPLMHIAQGTEKSGCVRFSFGYYNSLDEVDTAISALNDLTK